MEPYITTYTGRRVNPLALRPEDLCIEDIAHHLACVNRFNGALKHPVSVAQHSVYVAHLCVGQSYELQALLHDASEAYLGDVTKWLKESPCMAYYREAEDRAQQTIFEWAGCAVELHPAVEEADRLMVRFEAEQSGIEIQHPLYPYTTRDEQMRIGPWHPWAWKTAEAEFGLSYYRLFYGHP